MCRASKMVRGLYLFLYKRPARNKSKKLPSASHFAFCVVYSLNLT
jgi:hypothetical protein